MVTLSSWSLRQGVGFLRVGLRVPGERSAWDRRNPDHTAGLLLHRRLRQSGWVTLLHRWDWFLWSLKAASFGCPLFSLRSDGGKSPKWFTTICAAHKDIWLFIAPKEWGNSQNGCNFHKNMDFLVFFSFALQLVSRPLFSLATYLVSWWALFVPNCMLTLDLLTWVSVW